MIAFPEMLVSSAKNAGINIPKDLENYNKIDYPHWHVYCTLQLGSPMPRPDSHGINAKIIASIAKDKITELTLDQIIELGFEIGYSK